MMKAGLLAACLGALLLALSTHLGVVSGFVGVVVWAGLWWRLANILGWLLLVLGLFLQYLSVRRTPKRTTSAVEIHTLLALLERKGLLTHQDVINLTTTPRSPQLHGS